MPAATIATYNLRFDTPDAGVTADLRELAKHDARPSVLVLTEARNMDGGDAVDDFVADTPWRQFAPQRQDTRILWDARVWAELADAGAMKVYDQGPAGGRTPARWVVWQGLQHRPSMTNHLFIGSHVVSGYAGDEKPYQAWRDAAARAHFLAITQLAAHMMWHEANHFHHHHLMGDLNCAPRRTNEWWYPSRILESLWVPEQLPATLDWILHSRMSQDRGLKVRRRWAYRGQLHSDHAAHLKTISFPKAPE